MADYTPDQWMRLIGAANDFATLQNYAKRIIGTIVQLDNRIPRPTKLIERYRILLSLAHTKAEKLPPGYSSPASTPPRGSPASAGHTPPPPYESVVTPGRKALQRKIKRTPIKRKSSKKRKAIKRKPRKLSF